MEETAVLILCAGVSHRWNGTLKQLLLVAGESILQRQIRQIRQRSESDIWVITHQPEIAQVASDLGVDTFLPSARNCICQTLLSTGELWGNRTLVLLGDVIFSRYATDILWGNHAEIAVFGNLWEIYACAFDRSLHERIASVLEEQIAYQCDPARGKLRHFYERFCGLPQSGLEAGMDPNHPDPPDAEGKVMVWIQDYTNDMDTPEEYSEFRRRAVEWNRLDDLVPA